MTSQDFQGDQVTLPSWISETSFNGRKVKNRPAKKGGSDNPIYSGKTDS